MEMAGSCNSVESDRVRIRLWGTEWVQGALCSLSAPPHSPPPNFPEVEDSSGCVRHRRVMKRYFFS